MAPNNDEGRNETNGGPKAACDRCRGQKLRCIWEAKSQQCRRCTRAKTVCTVPPPRPLGRPPRQFRSSDCYFGWEEASVPYPDDTAMVMQPTLETTPIDSSSSSDSAVSAPPRDVSWIPASAPFSNTRNSISSSSSAVQTDFLDFLNRYVYACLLLHIWLILLISNLPDPTVGSIFTLSNDTNGSAVQSSRSSTHLSRDNTTSTSTLVSEGIIGNHVGISHNSAEDLDNGTVDSQDEEIQFLTQMCELNVALFQHPLHASSTPSKSILHSRTNSSASHSTSRTGIGTNSTLRISVADLEIGRLLSMTVQLRNLLAQLRATYTVRSPEFYDQTNVTQQRYPSQDRSTALLTMSCYARLDLIYTHTIEALREIRTCNERFKDTYRLMPELAIDGFSVGSCQDLQLDFAIRLCERTLISIREIIGINDKNQTPVDPVIRMN
jgi:hypothetical protein